MSKSIQHIAIIMDGNRRWARSQGLKTLQGYEKGVHVVKEVAEYCFSRSIPYLTFFAFSTENWKRPQLEVQFIEKLLTQNILKYQDFIVSNKISLKVIGDLSPFSPSLQQAYQKVCEETKNNKGLNMILAINYGGRKEIFSAVQAMLREKFSSLDPLNKEKLLLQIQNLSLKDMEKHLQSYAFPPPDLLIRTGGVNRLSNFYLWSSAYSELYFSNLNWPEFNSQELQKAIDSYSSSKRNFGGEGNEIN